jgi:hypothetical protein
MKGLHLPLHSGREAKQGKEVRPCLIGRIIEASHTRPGSNSVPAGPGRIPARLVRMKGIEGDDRPADSGKTEFP